MFDIIFSASQLMKISMLPPLRPEKEGRMTIDLPSIRTDLG